MPVPEVPVTMYAWVNMPKSEIVDSSASTRNTGRSSGNVTFE